jgi:hypothetical protein
MRGSAAADRRLSRAPSADAGAVCVACDDIMATRMTDWVNNFWKVFARDTPALRAQLGQYHGSYEFGAPFPLASSVLRTRSTVS